MNKIVYYFSKLLIVVSVIAFALSGCNTADLFTKKDDVTDYSDVLAVPENIEELKQKGKVLQGLTIEADAALNNDDFDSAEQLYNRIFDLDLNNLRAKEGMRRVAIFRQHEATIEQAQGLIGRSEQDDEKAATLLREVLVEDPENIEAASLYRAMVVREDEKRIEGLHKRLKYTNPVSLEFRDTQLKIIIEALAKGTGVNFILDKDVKSNLKASLFIQNVSLEDAIDVLVQSNQLKKKVLNENSVIIYPDTPLKTRQYQDLIIRSFFLEYADPETVSKLLKSMLGIRQIQTDDRLPMIMIKDVPEVMVLAEKLIKSQDLPEPEVMLEMEILEIRRTESTDKGVTWPTRLTVISSDGLTLEALKNVNSGDISVSPNPSIIFEGQDSNVNLLANPRIRVKNGESAKIHIGDRVPVITSNVSSNGVISDNVQYIDTGLKLEVQPTISMSGDVTIKLTLEVSSVGEIVTTITGASVPQIGTRSTSTELRLKDGETQILAGLISDADRETVNKIPGLGDIPILGRFFSTHSNEKVKTELVLSITPHIIRPRKSPDAALAEYWTGTELNAGRGFTQPRTREEISKLFKAGVAPGSANKPAVSKEPAAPQGLNIQLPPGLASEF
ncbi:MAG: type II secretion system protein GspD [Piscirickettsiaceae bacterium]|nr:type II secretion system protein GspD [Piscirickettsiaceae bacterium]